MRGKNDKKIHFIGIGGIGISALARYFLEKGWQVSGSDLVSSETLESLKKAGAKIFIGPQKAENLPAGTEKVIYSPAVKSDNPELKKAEIGVRPGSDPGLTPKCQSYPEALGELTKEHFTIAVSGTHGKSTTSAMITLILIKGGLDPTVVIGTKLKEFGNSNFRMGRGKPRTIFQRDNNGKNTTQKKVRGKYLVIEADEWQASFLNYWPKIIVLTNIEEEHLDYYKNLEHILNTYKEYINHLPEDGVLVVNGDDENIRRVLNPKSEIRNPKQSNPTGSLTLRAIQQNSKFKTQNFSLKQPEAKKIKEILKIPGEHNVANALAALAAARILGIDDRISFEALAEYKGSWRRFDVTRKDLVTLSGKVINFTLINDYAHHPTEIRATLKAVREKYSKEKIWCIFQPHQYQRTFHLFDDFVKIFQEALCPAPRRGAAKEKIIDRLIITDIYDVAGRENQKIKEKVSSQKLVEAINRDPVSAQAETGSLEVLYLAKDKIIPYLKKNLKDKEIIVLMGAGDVYDLSTALLDKKN